MSRRESIRNGEIAPEDLAGWEERALYAEGDDWERDPARCFFEYGGALPSVVADSANEFVSQIAISPDGKSVAVSSASPSELVIRGRINAVIPTPSASTYMCWDGDALCCLEMVAGDRAEEAEYALVEYRDGERTEHPTDLRTLRINGLSRYGITRDGELWIDGEISCKAKSAALSPDGKWFLIDGRIDGVMTHEAAVWMADSRSVLWIEGGVLHRCSIEGVRTAHGPCAPGEIFARSGFVCVVGADGVVRVYDPALMLQRDTLYLYAYAGHIDFADTREYVYLSRNGLVLGRVPVSEAEVGAVADVLAGLSIEVAPIFPPRPKRSAPQQRSVKKSKREETIARFVRLLA